MNTSFESCAVKIAVRERPMREVFENDESNVIIYPSTKANVLVVDERPFVFDFVLRPEVSQKTLFDDIVKPLVEKVLQGYSCSTLAYGQTGTGKSYTMGLNTNQSFEGEHVGVIPRCLTEIFNSDNNNENIHLSQNREIYISFVEIYNEKVYDLFADNYRDSIFVRGGKYTGGSLKKITNLEECCYRLNQGSKNRHVRPTKMNSQSSRSHAIFTIHVKTKTSREETISSSLNLVDLAGSEGVRRTGHQGVAMSEGVHINQGLLSIGKVLQAMTLGHKVIPYRDSVLTSVLQDSLNPNSYLTLVACISPLKEDLSETLSTLRFAQNAKQLKHSPQINSILNEFKKNKAKTPYKRGSTNLQTPNNNLYFRNSTATKNVNSLSHHRHTFCTPNKLKKNDSNKFNRTEMGLTPKEKQKLSMHVQHVKKYPLSRASNQQEPNRETLFDKNDDTLESRSSIFSLNISTSTAVDVPSNNHQVTSYSPVIKKYINELEKKVDSKMNQVIETLKSVQHAKAYNDFTYRTEITPFASTPANFEAPMSNIFRRELKEIVKEIFDRKSPIRKAAPKDKVDELRNLSLSPKANAKCQLFATSSPVFKVPAVPQIANQNSKTENYSELNFSCTNEETDVVEQTVRTFAVRRSTRLSVISVNDSSTSDSSFSRTRRKSKRLTSIKEIHDEKRRSIRIASKKNYETLGSINEKQKKINNKKKNSLDNSVISSYFDTTNWENKTSKNPNIIKHKKAILELLNKGSIKDLQLLPQIGQKTAYQIITQRTLNGKFKSIAQVEKLPVWRGNGWNRFAEANMLL